MTEFEKDNNKRRLHIGGTKPRDTWEILNIVDAPYVDHVGNAKDMSAFEDSTFDEIYASHVLEHFDYFSELTIVLREWNRILKSKGKLYISVPDIDVLSTLLLDKSLEYKDTFKIMRMMFGGQINPYDYHKAGFNERILRQYLSRHGFKKVKKVDRFGIFKDTSSKVYLGRLISLNVIAIKTSQQG